PLARADTPADAMARVPSIELFVRSARQVRPGLTPRDEDWPHIAAIVERVEGIPLAIELAAARTSILDFAELERRLAAPLDLLVRRGSSHRHGSMRRAIADSYALLTADEKLAFQALSLFRGGCSLDAAEAVLAVPEVLETLEALIARSMARRDERDGATRISLFESLREFAAEQLSATPEVESGLRTRHAAYFARLARDTAVGHTDRLVPELDNLALAFDHLLDTDAHGALAIATAMSPVLAFRGAAPRRLALLERALGRLSVPPPQGLVERGIAFRDQGDHARARTDLERATADAERAGAWLPRVRGELALGELVEVEGDTASAIERFRRAEMILARAPWSPVNDRLHAEIHQRVGHSLRREGNLDGARREIEAAVEGFRRAGDARALSLALYEAGVIALFARRYEETFDVFREALTWSETQNDRLPQGAIHCAFGVLQQERGQFDEADDHHRRAVEVYRRLGQPYREGSARYYLASLHLERGQLDDARTVLRQAYDLMARVGAPRYVALIRGLRAVCEILGGRPEAAAESLHAARRAAESCRTERSLGATLAIHAMHLEAHDTGDFSRLAAASDVFESDWGDDPRLAYRLFAHRAAQHEQGTSAPPAPRLLVHEEGRAFRLPGANVDVDLSRRKPLKRIVYALTQNRLDKPGEGLDIDELFAAGWPGERLRRESLRNRVHVALSTLRKLGLRDHLVGVTGGYALRPDQIVELRPAGRGRE
ncbi:MAG: tetratricopeptide repeat protein, partial [Myxococcota bacterium]